MTIFSVKGERQMKKSKEEKILSRLRTAFIKAIGITSIAAIAALIMLLYISNRYTYALQNYGFSQGDIGKAMMLFSETRSATRGIIGYVDEDAINSMQTDLAEAKDQFQEYWDTVENTLNNDKERSLYKEATEILDDYWVLCDEVIRQGNTTDAAKSREAQIRMTNEVTPMYNEVYNVMLTLLNANVDTGTELDDNLNLIGNIMLVAVVFILVCSFALSINMGNRIAQGITTPLIALQNRLTMFSHGDLSSEFPKTEMNDEIAGMIATTEQMSLDLKAIIVDINYCLNEMANGNYTVKSQIGGERYEGEFKGIIDGLREMRNQVSETLLNIRNASAQVTAGADNLSQAAQSIAEGATDQSAAVEELQATIANITAGVEKTSENVDSSYHQARNYANEADRSRAEMEGMMSAMTKINETSQKIENIISEIEDIASQTNLLSLNAAIEAARAGEAGKGFAVVADQIRKLAEQSAQSAVDTRRLIEGSLEEIAAGNTAAQRAAASIEEVVKGIKEIAETQQELNDISSEQASAMEQAEKGINQISEVVQANSASAEETSATSEELSAQAISMNELIDRFTLR